MPVISIFDIKPVRIFLVVILFGLGKGAEHGGGAGIVCGIGAFFVLCALDRRLLWATADGAHWVLVRVVDSIRR